MEYNYELLVISVEKKIGTVSLDSQPNLNALNIQISEELSDALAKMNIDDDIKVIVIKGIGKGFSSGGDIKEMKQSLENDPKQYMDDLTSPIYIMIQKIFLLSKPVIASVHGFAMGAGCGLALACDFIIATKKARFSESFIKIGLIPAGTATYLLPRFLTSKKASEMLFFGSTLRGDEAEKYGLINKAVENEEELERVTYEYAERLAKGPTKAYEKIKKLLSKTFSLPMAEFLELERQYQIEMAETEDYKEGVNAFLEKREARYKGI
ncbi:MAG: enoyl-CoA hydratase/isomerase family protein [Promethearchaeota archaeon]